MEVDVKTPQGIDDYSTDGLDILLLGGSGFLGMHYIAAALARGHHVSVFHRGQSNPTMPEGVASIIGERERDLESLAGRNWDAIVDIATFEPGWIEPLRDTLADKTSHYTFISTVSVYEAPSATCLTDERASLIAISEQSYGGRKVACEHAAQRVFSNKCLILRPGHIVGPGEHTNYFPYWIERIVRGGQIACPVDSEAPFQMIDVRDLAAWNIRLIERQMTGIFNAVGPLKMTTFGDFIASVQRCAAHSSELIHVPLHAVEECLSASAARQLGFWALSEASSTIMLMDNTRAQNAGLTCRDLSLTVGDTLAWLIRADGTRRLSVVPLEDASDLEFGWRNYLARERMCLRKALTTGEKLHADHGRL